MAQFERCEPDERVRTQDFRTLAKYLINVGSNTNLALRFDTLPYRLSPIDYRAGDSEHQLDLQVIRKLISKYNLKYQPIHNYSDNQGPDFTDESVFTLEHLANSQPREFLIQAGIQEPGTYDQRRFWWCAGNWNFYVRFGRAKQTAQLLESMKNHQPDPGETMKTLTLAKNLSSSRFLSDVLCQVLTFSDRKLITVAALHLSVRYSNHRTYHPWFKKNLGYVKRQIAISNLDHQRPFQREFLRKTLFIREAEDELEMIDVPLFIHWWNMTGLERVSESQITQLTSGDEF